MEVVVGEKEVEDWRACSRISLSMDTEGRKVDKARWDPSLIPGLRGGSKQSLLA